MYFIYQQKKVLSYWAGFLVFMVFFFYFDKRKVYQNSIITKGVVVEIYHQERNALNRVGYDYPLYEFSFQGNSYFSSDERIFVRDKSKGDSINIIFRRDNPQESQIYSIFSYWFNSTKLVFGFLIAFAIFAIPRVIADFYNDFFKKV